jgi:hypothetical protein
LDPQRKLTPEKLERARDLIARSVRDTGTPHYERAAFAVGVTKSSLHAALNPAERKPDEPAAVPVDCHWCGKLLAGHPRCANQGCGKLIHEGPMQERYRCGCGVAHVHGKDGLCNSCYGKRPDGYEHTVEEMAWQWGMSAKEMAAESRRLRAIAAARLVFLPGARGVPSAASYIEQQVRKIRAAVGALPEFGGKRAAVESSLDDYAKRV